jgi:hypothetical protein
MTVIKFMSSTFSDFDARQEQSWNAENFGKATAQLVTLAIAWLMLDAGTGLGRDPH